MENILAAMSPEPSSLWAGIHALNLAKRIKAHVSFLLVIPPARGHATSQSERDAETNTGKIQALIDEGRADGVPLDYYQAHGDYASELIRHIQQNRITLLVIASPAESDAQEVDFKEFLEKLHHRLTCRIEVVHMKPLS
jgi:nucleotide-binding universal stress UspA family protein